MLAFCACGHILNSIGRHHHVCGYRIRDNMQLIHWIYAILWLLAIPTAAGMVLTWHTDKRENIGFALVCGYAGSFALAQLLIVPAIFLKASLGTVVLIYQVLMLAASVAGLCLNYRGLRGMAAGVSWRERPVKLPECILFSLAVLLVIVQMLATGILAHYDADDSFYVATASTSVYTDTLFKYSPYTGAKYRRLPSRYVLSPFPIYEAVLTKLVGAEVPFFVYTIFPVILVLVAYVVYGLWASMLFGDDRKKCALFLIFISAVQIFSNYSIYTSGTFFLMRIWQGKAILAGVLLPMLAYMCARLMLKDEGGGGWPVLFCLMAASCLASSMGIILSMLMLGIYTFVCGVCSWKWEMVGKAMVCCLPNVVFAIIYLVIR